MNRLGILFWLLLAGSVQAAELTWDQQTITSPLTVERSTTNTGPFSTVATLPNGATSYILTPGTYGWYRVRNSAGPSNVVQFSADLYTGLVTDRLTALETNVTAIETVRRLDAIEAQRKWDELSARLVLLEAPVVITPPPAQTSNLTVRQIDADHIEITCNGIGITTTGTGTRRIMECRH